MDFLNELTTAVISNDTETLTHEPNFRAGIYKNLSGLYLYGFGANQGVSPNNETNDANNRVITGWNPNSILYDSKPNWVGFLNYKSNNEVHFNNYLGNDNNGSRFTILSKNLTRTNKHFINFNGSIAGALNYYCGQMLLDNNTSIFRKAMGVIVVGEHAEITALGYPSTGAHIWLIRKVNNALVVQDIIEPIRVALELTTVEETFACFRGDDMYFISEDYPTDVKYPYILSDDSFVELIGEDEKDIYNYLTVYTIDQNNYIRATGRQVIDVEKLKNSLLYLNKNNFNDIVLNNLNYNNIIKFTDSDYLKFIKFIEFYVRTSPRMGDSSSCHFIREVDNSNIDVFVGGTATSFPEIYPIVDNRQATTGNAGNLVNKFLNYLEQLAINVIGMQSFTKPNVINLNDEVYKSFADIIEYRKQNYKVFKRYQSLNNTVSVLSQAITTDLNANTTVSSMYLPNTIKFDKILDIEKTKFLTFKEKIINTDWNSYPISTMSGTNDDTFTQIGRSLEYIDTESTFKCNTDYILYFISANSFLSTYLPLSEQQIAFADTALSEDSILKKVIQKQIYNNGTSELNIEFNIKKLDGTLVPYSNYDIMYQYTSLDTASLSYASFNPPIAFISDASLLSLVHDFYNSSDFSFLEFITYKKNSNNLLFKFDSVVPYYYLNLNLNFLEQGEILKIKIINPYNSSEYFTTDIIKEAKNLTTTVSSYSSIPNTLEYAGPKITNYSYVETFQYIDPECYGGVNLDADFNNDGKVDGIDLGTILSYWGSTNPNFRITGGNFVGGADLAVLLGSWGDIQAVDSTAGTNCDGEITVTQQISVPYSDLVPEENIINTNNPEIRPNRIYFFPNQLKPTSNNEIIVE